MRLVWPSYNKTGLDDGRFKTIFTLKTHISSEVSPSITRKQVVLVALGLCFHLISSSSCIGGLLAAQQRVPNLPKRNRGRPREAQRHSGCTRTPEAGTHRLRVGTGDRAHGARSGLTLIGCRASGSWFCNDSV